MIQHYLKNFTISRKYLISIIIFHVKFKFIRKFLDVVDIRYLENVLSSCLRKFLIFIFYFYIKLNRNNKLYKKK